MVFLIFAMILLVFLVAAAWTARLLSIGLRDAQDLAAKVAVPRPISPTQWPELGIDEVMCDPETTDRVLLVVRWPAHPSVRTLMVLEGTASSSARRRLAKWRDDGSSISPRPKVWPVSQATASLLRAAAGPTRPTACAAPSLSTRWRCFV